jgi:hypothetical protein
MLKTAITPPAMGKLIPFSTLIFTLVKSLLHLVKNDSESSKRCVDSGIPPNRNVLRIIGAFSMNCPFSNY